MTVIRIVEDNQEIAELLSVLVSEGHTVDAVTKNFEGPSSLRKAWIRSA